MIQPHKLLAVPSSYLGVWSHTLLEQHGSQDTTSLVLWLQAHYHHIDIRIPASRPDFSNCTCLQDYSAEQLRWSATQQGFFGITEVNGTVCHWHRELYFQSTNGVSDIGEIVFDGVDTLLETGIESDYFEIWKKIEGTHLNINTYRVNSFNRHGDVVEAHLIKAGNIFAFIRPRSEKLPEYSCLLAAIDAQHQNHHNLLNWLDFEISFGEIVDDAHGKIMHSTFPFREGELPAFS